MQQSPWIESLLSLFFFFLKKAFRITIVLYDNDREVIQWKFNHIEKKKWGEKNVQSGG